MIQAIKASTRIELVKRLTLARMAKAAGMLRQKDLSVNAICNRVGFADPVSFGKLFRRYYDQTPGEFRAMYLRSRQSTVSSVSTEF